MATGLADCNSRFERLSESGIIGIFEGDDSGRILKANSAFLEALGYSRADLEEGHIRWDRLAVPGYEHIHRRVSEKLVESGNAEPVELEYFRKDGSRIPVLVGLASIGDVRGGQAVGFMLDLTARTRAEAELRRSEEQFRQLAENIREVFWMMNLAGTEMLYVSPAYEQIWGQSCDSLYADPESWMNSIYPEDRAAAQEMFLRQLGGEVLENEYRIVQPSGNIRWIRDRAFPVRDKEGRIVRLAGVADDVTDRKASELKLIHQNLHDDLTDLPNRRFFREKLARAIAERENDAVGAVFFIDLDRFKLVNDTLGHSAGDRILKQVVGRFLRVCGESSVLARFGGDEFTVLSVGLEGSESARRIGEGLIASLDDPFGIEGRNVYIGASIGISLFPDNGTDPILLKRAADLAMHEAKRSGRNQLSFFQNALVDAAQERLETETRLRTAIAGREFILQFQPQFASGNSFPSRFEALVRWRPPGEAMVPPARFIPIAERNGLIVPIGTWVLQDACRQCAEWQAGGFQGVGVAVNVSPAQFACPDFVGVVTRTLKETGLPANLLELELTETVFVKDMQASARTLTELRNIGITIALDDFGTGYSSLSYLQNLPLDALKIDRSFVAETGGRPRGVAVLRCVIELAHAHGLRVIGEGVETAEQLKLLENLRCDETQGFLMGRPMSDIAGGNWTRPCAEEATMFEDLETIALRVAEPGGDPVAQAA